MSQPLSVDRLSLYAELIRLNRPIGIFLLLWPGLWALWIAGAGQPTWWVVLIFLAGTALMRSAGCAINDYADRDFDGHVARTHQRPIASGRVSPREALMVFVVLSLLAFVLVLFLNSTTILMSFVAVALAGVYPFMKRYTHMPQLVLGMAFGWAVPMAFTALQEATLEATCEVQGPDHPDTLGQCVVAQQLELGGDRKTLLVLLFGRNPRIS